VPDMLVKLYDLPDAQPWMEKLTAAGLCLRRAMAHEKRVVAGWVLETFGEAWAAECECAFSKHPVSCFIVVREGRVIGFACHDCTAPDFFGPAGVAESERGCGVGAALLLAALRSMAEQGYAYAIIGGAGSTAFYSRVAGAVEIPQSSPGIYPPKLHPPS
jgi:GNAT superfamily N-acetyltransferase